MTGAPDPPAPDPRFEALRQKSIELAKQGRLEEALGVCDEALHWARQNGSPSNLELATCNRGFALVTLGRGGEVVTDLRRILLSSAVPFNRHLAAYNISLFHDSNRNFEKSLFYARLALDHAEQAGDPESEARSHNRIANVKLVDCGFAEARQHFLQALQKMPGDDGVHRVIVLGNLGYCHFVEGYYPDGFRCLFESLRTLRRLPFRLVPRELLVRLNLAYGYLQLARYRRAIRHAEAALLLAEELDERESLAKTLYILGEARKRAGDGLRAYACFRRLQEELYPDNPRLAELLLATDTANLVNLWA